uniref:Uncharacterized protein n=1 Tax=Arundo donax TaxID=35708 RepID=A0A0A9BRL0_ARUDO
MGSSLPPFSAPVPPEHNPDPQHKYLIYRTIIFFNNPDGRLQHRPSPHQR